jgi:hypothetical protein
MKTLEMEKNECIERILGLHWDTQDDVLVFKTSFKKIDPAIIKGTKAPTKREVLGVVMSMFDPLGLLAHYTVKGKILLQEIWRQQLGWDDELSPRLFVKWVSWIGELKDIGQWRIPRCYTTLRLHHTCNELHVFCDASEEAYSAAAYLRVKADTSVETRLVMGKSRVAPLKPLSIPRMELLAAVMGVRIAKCIQNDLDVPLQSCHYWTDSRTVACWIRTADPRKFKQFVAHRIGEILETSEPSSWRWVPTKENVADEATRGDRPTDFSPESRWNLGPSFLLEDPNNWPREKSELHQEEMEDLEMKNDFLGVVKEDTSCLPDITRFSHLGKLLRITGWMLRFISNMRINSEERVKGPVLLPSEIRKAEGVWHRKSQEDTFR